MASSTEDMGGIKSELDRTPFDGYSAKPSAIETLEMRQLTIAVLWVCFQSRRVHFKFSFAYRLLLDTATNITVLLTSRVTATLFLLAHSSKGSYKESKAAACEGNDGQITGMYAYYI